MISAHDAMATAAVRDLAAARRFYEGALGLEPVGNMNGVVKYRSGNSAIIIYQSDTGGQNPATSITWGVGAELDDIVTRLHAANVKFEHYDLPGMSLAGDVHVAGEFKGVWVRDSDGNILHLNNQ